MTVGLSKSRKKAKPQVRQNNEYRKVIKINGINSMVFLTFLNTEIRATVSVAASEAQSCFRKKFMPFKTNFSEKDFEKEIQRLYFEIIDESLKL